MVKHPGDVNMIVAAIVYQFYANNVKSTKLFNYDDLISLTERKFFSREDLNKLWDEQKLKSGECLVDCISAFQFLTPEEQEFLLEEREEM